ncbi:MAG: hypothetical protein II908_02965 [Bacteroidaceae bacterium]|nr:hypothetical protein [Bacteroidaceae bacterium]
MKKIVSILICSLFALGANAQGFDASKNYQGENLQAYIGQTVRVRAKPADKQAVGYGSFFKVPKFAGGEVYSPNEQGNTEYAALRGRLFHVVDVFSREADAANGEKVGAWQTLDATKVYYLVMTNADDTVYYKYPDKEASYQLISDAYVAASKEGMVGNTYCLVKKFAFRKYGSTETFGAAIPSMWTVTDFVLNPVTCAGFVYKIESDQGQVSTISLQNLQKVFISKAQFIELTEKYPTDFDKALNGGPYVGEPEELLVLKWGQPDSKANGIYTYKAKKFRATVKAGKVAAVAAIK